MIYFDKNAPGGGAIVASALRSLDTGEPFSLPSEWQIVGVRGGDNLLDSGKRIVTLTYLGDDRDLVAGGDPGPAPLSASEEPH